MSFSLRVKPVSYVLILTAFAATPARASLTFITDPGAGTGAERCLSGGAGDGGTCSTIPTGAGNKFAGLDSMVQLFADSQGASLVRIDDSDDQVWTAGTGSGVFGLARSASRNFTLGELSGVSGNSYTQVLNTIGSSGSPTVFLPSIPSGQNGNGDLQVSGYDTSGLPQFTSISTGTFRFAIQCGASCTPVGQTWSSNPSDNSDGDDHMVTWQLIGGNVPVGDTWYVAGFENGTDFDFNDYVFVFQNVTPGADAPEPSSVTLLGGSLVLLAAFSAAFRNPSRGKFGSQASRWANVPKTVFSPSAKG